MTIVLRSGYAVAVVGGVTVVWTSSGRAPVEPQLEFVRMLDARAGRVPVVDVARIDP